MRFLLDTNACIGYIAGRNPNLLARFGAAVGQMDLCSVVKAELIFGAHKSAQVQTNLARLSPFFSALPSVNFDDAAAGHYGRIRSQLERAGTPIGPNDLFIAAIALANDLTLVTHNTREFMRVAGLKLQDWE